MKPDRTDEFIHKLYYETSRFSAFKNQWVVRARINNSQRDPTLSCEREMTYQVILVIPYLFLVLVLLFCFALFQLAHVYGSYLSLYRKIMRFIFIRT